MKTLIFYNFESLKNALRETGPRRIVPDLSLWGETISGNFSLEGGEFSDFILDGTRSPFAINGSLKFKGVNDFRLHNLRVQEAQGPTGDCVSINDCANFVVTNCSFAHGTDENFEITGNSRNGRVSKCLIFYALSNGGHPEGEHSKGMMIVGGSQDPDQGFPDEILVEKTAFILNASRNPNVQGNSSGVGGNVDLKDLVVYGWGGKALEQKGPHFGTQYGRGAKGTISSCLYLGNQYSSGPIINIKKDSDVSVLNTYFSDNRDIINLSDFGLGDKSGDVAKIFRRMYVKRLRQIQSWGAQPWGDGEYLAYDDLITWSGVPGVPSHKHFEPRLF